MSQTVKEALGDEARVVHVSYLHIPRLEAVPTGGMSEGTCENVKALQLKRLSSARKVRPWEGVQASA